MADPAVSILNIDYTSKDYAGFTASMLDYATRVFPDWTDRSAADFGVMMVELFAYMGDILSYYQDRIADEAYIATATQRSSVLAIAQTLGYLPTIPVAATGTVTLASDSSQTTAVTVPAGTQIQTDYIKECKGPLTFETFADVVVPPNGGVVSVVVSHGARKGNRFITVNVPDASNNPVPTQVLVETLGVSDGRRGQSFVLGLAPVLLDEMKIFVEYPLGPHEWTRVNGLLVASSRDYVFLATVDELQRVIITFGDGVSGAIPPAGLTVSASYRVGGGAKGNVAANAVKNLVSTVPGVSVQSSSAMAGGLDEESTDSIRTNAPLAFRTQDRAVSLDDFANLALKIDGVEQANAVAQSFTNVTVYITGPNNSAPSQAVKDAVAAYLQPRALAGVTITVSSGTLVPINIGVPAEPIIVRCRPHCRRWDVRLACIKAIRGCFTFTGGHRGRHGRGGGGFGDFVEPGDILFGGVFFGTHGLGGGFGRRGGRSFCDFGARITHSQILAVIHVIECVEWCQIPVFCRADGVQSGVADVVCRHWERAICGDINISVVGGI